jgi:ribosome-associated protein
MSTTPKDESRPITVTDMPIELCQLLKFAALTSSGGEAKQAISQGRVQVNGAFENRKRRKLALGDRVTFMGQTIVVAG